MRGVEKYNMLRGHLDNYNLEIYLICLSIDFR
jgi:hypothetical protein